MLAAFGVSWLKTTLIQKGCGLTVLILCNGLPPSAELFEECYDEADYFIAADGGGNVARTFEKKPHVVIGDLDSFEEQPGEDLDIIHKPDQETNDLEKALEVACDKGAEEVTVLGATGQRLDHTLKNLSVLKQFNSHFKKLIFRDDFGDLILLPGSFTSRFPVGTKLSLFPLSGKVSGIFTKGLQYALEGEEIENGVRDGSSNEVVSSPVTITHEEGDLLLFIVSD